MNYLSRSIIRVTNGKLYNIVLSEFFLDKFFLN